MSHVFLGLATNTFESYASVHAIAESSFICDYWMEGRKTDVLFHISFVSFFGFGAQQPTYRVGPLAKN